MILNKRTNLSFSKIHGIQRKLEVVRCIIDLYLIDLNLILIDFRLIGLINFSVLKTSKSEAKD